MDLAYKKNTYQSSTLIHFGVPATPDKAVDGNVDTRFDQYSCTHTRMEISPYWYVDLGRNHDIKHVEILNRGDCCSKFTKRAD